MAHAMSSGDDWLSASSEEEADGVDGSSQSDSDCGASVGNELTFKMLKIKPGEIKQNKPKARPQCRAKPLPVTCFAASCGEKRATWSKLCKTHEASFQASQCAAARTGNLKIHKEMFVDPYMAALAFHEFEMRCSPSKCRAKH